MHTQANPFPRFTLTMTICIGLFLAACDPHTSTPPNTLSIVPSVCDLNISETAGFSINGSLTSNSIVTWSAQYGLITKDPNDYSATYIAPAIPIEDVITAVIEPGPSGQTESLTRNCTIGGGALTVLPTFTPPNPANTPYPIAISEVMSNPCGGNDFKKWNQYVELYNYGDQPVDVRGWFLFDEGETGTPDQLVPWVSRSYISLDASLVTNSTVIPPRGFALILSPAYTDAILPYRMPYSIPPGTLILTAATGNALGDDTFNIIGSENGYDTLTLYIGSLTVINHIVDTYGTPEMRGPHPQDIDNNFDNFPIYLSACYSSERIDPHQPDSPSNWMSVENGTPGDGPYR